MLSYRVVEINSIAGAAGVREKFDVVIARFDSTANGKTMLQVEVLKDREMLPPYRIIMGFSVAHQQLADGIDAHFIGLPTTTTAVTEVIAQMFPGDPVVAIPTDRIQVREIRAQNGLGQTAFKPKPRPTELFEKFPTVTKRPR